MHIKELEDIIEEYFPNIKQVSSIDTKLKDAINQILNLLETGQLRVAEFKNNSWQINQWIKKAILLYFRISENHLVNFGDNVSFDKIPLQFTNLNEDFFQKKQLRIVPQGYVRRGSFIGNNTILMPSYVNIGAYIGSNCMIDTWATVGSCAQIGNNVHLSGGAGIGGVLEPLQAQPTIIEDDCFIGARSEIVEGVIVEKGSVISMGVFIGQSTKIYDRTTDEIIYGKIPAGSVVVPGTLPSANGKYSLSAAIIIKKVDAKTKNKVALNELLRD